MKMYKFECWDVSCKRIEVAEFEVEENLNSYKVTNSTVCIYGSIVKKSDLDTIIDPYAFTMFSLFPKKSVYIEKLSAILDEKIDKARVEFDKLSTRRENLFRLYEVELEKEGEK